MNNKYKNRILRNLDYLIENTTSIETLCVKLISKGHLTVREFQILKSYPSDEQKCTELYTGLVKKPNNSFEDLLKVLEETGNVHIADKLKLPIAQELREEALAEQRARNAALKVENSHLPWIVEILSQIPSTEWQIIMRSLVNHDGAAINDLNKTASNTSMGHSTLVCNTLEFWKSRNGNGATVELLIKTLREHESHYAADCLEEERRKF